MTTWMHCPVAPAHRVPSSRGLLAVLLAAMAIVVMTVLLQLGSATGHPGESSHRPPSSVEVLAGNGR